MKSFMSDIHLKSILPDDKPTFHHNNQISESQIDHILIFIPDSCENVSVQFTEQLCQKENDDNLSSHDVIVGQLCLPQNTIITSEPDYSSSYTDFNRKKPRWDESGMLA